MTINILEENLGGNTYALTKTGKHIHIHKVYTYTGKKPLKIYVIFHDEKLSKLSEYCIEHNFILVKI